MTETCAFAASDGMRHGNGVVQPPLLLTKTRFDGVGSEMTTLVAVVGPLFVTMTLKSMRSLNAACNGPALSTLRSATPVPETGVTAVALLLARFDSGEDVLTLAAFVMDGDP